MALRVNIEDLVASGVAATNHGEDVATRHAAADNKIDVAQFGWQGLSAAALGACTQSWRSTTTTLLARISDHAQGLHGSARAFAEMESANSQALERVAPSTGQP